MCEFAPVCISVCSLRHAHSFTQAVHSEIQKSVSGKKKAISEPIVFRFCIQTVGCLFLNYFKCLWIFEEELPNSD